MKKKLLLAALAVLILLGSGSLLNPRWRSFVVGRLRNEPSPQGRPISYWQETLRQEDSELAAQGIEALAHAGVDAVPVLISSLGDPDVLARERAAEALAKMGTTSVPALINALNQEDPYVRVGAARGLLHMGPTGKDAVPSLIQAINDEQTFVRKMARGALSHMNKEAVPELAKALKRKDPVFRYRVLEILKDLGPDASQAAPEIAEALTDGNVAVQEMALLALETIGPEAKVAIPQLREAAKAGANKEVRPLALDVLCRVDPGSRETIALIVSAMQDVRIRYPLVEDLGRLGQKAKSALPALDDALNDKDPSVREAAAEALRKIDFDRAKKYYEDTIKREPKNPNAYRNMAWLLAACPDSNVRNAKNALESGTKACELTGWKMPSCLAALAAAYAEAGDFDSAARYEQKSVEISLAMNGDQDPGLPQARSRLQLYQARKPFREGQ
jgi:HEAT repeat protein